MRLRSHIIMDNKCKSPATTHTLNDNHYNHIASSLRDLHINSKNTPSTSFYHPPVSRIKTTNAPSLISLCITIIGKHLEDLILDLGDIAASFPAYIKKAIAAIARRRNILNDEVLVSLVDETWDILDISGSDVSDYGLAKVAEICRSLRAVDISRCRKITPNGVSQLVQHCRSLETLRCGGCPQSDLTARRSLGLFKPELNSVEGNSWEELDTTEITRGGESLQWVVWPKIDPDFLECFISDCPRVKVNPKPSPLCFKGVSVPREALSNIVLDDPFVEDIDPSTWASFVPPGRIVAQEASSPTELSKAERFRLAFVERDMRMAPKRAKNARQHQRRAQGLRMMSMEAKAIALASKASKTLLGRD